MSQREACPIAWGEIAPHIPAMRRITWKLPDHDTEDVVQEAIARTLSIEEEARDVRRLLLVVTRNYCQGARFSDERRRDRERLAAVRDIDARTPDQPMIASEQRAAVRAAVDRLPRRERDAVRARFYDGDSIPQIARSEGCSVRAVRYRLSAAAEMLRKPLARIVR